MAARESINNRKARTTVRNFIKKRKEERTIEFDPLGMPTGSNMNVFQAVLSYVVRETLGYTVHSWKKVPQIVKEAMWKDVKVQNEL
jgi:S-ribosylhomocysteine lyase LuxS involved in autoinducer biosynthesis